MKTVGAGIFIGIEEARENKAFDYGTLYVDEDDTILCYIEKFDFLRAVNEKDIRKLIGTEEDCAKFPNEEDIIVRKRAEVELQHLRSKILLNAAGKNIEPKNARPFDTKLYRTSPNKRLQNGPTSMLRGVPSVVFYS